MTNKVKPFYIRITDDMTPQMVQDAFDKCVDAGAVAHDGMNIGKDKCKYKHLYNSPFDFFGVDAIGNTCTTVTSFIFGGVAQEITLDQLDEWLGLKSKVDWDGNGLPPVGTECEILFKEYPHKGFGLFSVLGYHGGVIWVQYTGPLENNGKCYTAECSTLEFRKPETPEQKAERERDEAIKTIQRDMAFSGSDYHAAKRLYEKGYRKQ